MMWVFKKLVSFYDLLIKIFTFKMFGSFQDLLVKMLAFIGVVTSLFLVGNSVSDPSSVVQALHALNTTSISCDPKQVALHYKNLAIDVTFLSIAMALAACIVYCVKIIVDTGAQEEEQEQREADPAAAVERTRATNASKAASNAEADAVQAEVNAKRAAAEMSATFDNAFEVKKNTRSEANRAIEAAQAAEGDLAQAKTNPGDDVVAAQKKIEDLEMAADKAAMAATQAEGTAANAEKELDFIGNDLKEANDEVKRKADATRAAKKDAEAAKKTVAAVTPKTGMARFPLWKRLILRLLFEFATIVSLYACVVAIFSFTELLEYKTGCVRFVGDSGSRYATRTALSVFKYMLFVASCWLHLMILIGACWKD